MLDRVSRVDRLPCPGENVYSRERATFLGGKGFNQALAAHRFGANVTLISCLGDDDGWDMLNAFMRREGMDTGGLLQTDEAPTGQADIWVQADGLNMICAAPGANDLLHPCGFLPDWADGQVAMFGSGTVLSQLEVPDVAARTEGDFRILNPAPMRDFDRTMLQGLDLVTPNGPEALALTGVDPVDGDACDRAGRLLLDEGVRHVVVTLGDRGCYFVDRTTSRHFPSPRVASVDTTAAGDVFNGVLAALHQSYGLTEALPWAIAAASLSTTVHGAAASVPARSEVEAFMATL